MWEFRQQPLWVAICSCHSSLIALLTRAQGSGSASAYREVIVGVKFELELKKGNACDVVILRKHYTVLTGMSGRERERERNGFKGFRVQGKLAQQLHRITTSHSPTSQLALLST